MKPESILKDAKFRWLDFDQIVKKKPFLGLFPIEQINVDTIAAHIKIHGFDLSQPIICWWKQDNGKQNFYLIDGHTRFQAAQQAGLKDIPYKVVDPKAIMPGSKKTWEQAFNKRFNDQRNVSAGGAVPSGGLSTQPGIAP